ncbi:uncharacterized protein LOC134255536 [Saccostrea cucullata]|uniref:uncharacterized protein LOC134255536 n=1 Tax=Saccostrea cuccullata TaxID=36930 RepID=UPI002ED594C1
MAKYDPLWHSISFMDECKTSILLGTLPLVSDGEVDRVVCQSGISGCCETSLTIKLRNCGTFYVYFLRKPSGCPVSYCFGTQPINSTDVTTSSLQTTDVTTSSLQTTDETTIHTTDAYNTDSTPSTTKPNESSKSILNDVHSDIIDVEIIGIVLGVVFGVLLPGIIIVLYSSHQKKKSRVWPSDGYQLNDVENQLSLNTTSEIQNPDLEQTPAWEDSTKSEIVNPDAEQHPDRGDSITSENPDLVQNKDREETVLSIKGVSPSLFPTIKPSRKRIRN